MTVYHAEHGPGGEAPATPREQLSRLLEREPSLDVQITELAERRAEATRRALVRTEGIPAERLRSLAPRVEADASGEGRVEFAIGGEQRGWALL